MKFALCCGSDPNNMTWDNNNGCDYCVTDPGLYFLGNGGTLAPATTTTTCTSTCTSTTVPVSVLFYQTGWTQVNCHFQTDGAAWTAVPGRPMDRATVVWSPETSASAMPDLYYTFFAGERRRKKEKKEGKKE